MGAVIIDHMGVGMGAVIIGHNTCRNHGSGTFVICSNAIMIGRGPVDGHMATTDDSITIGRDMCIDSASTIGQITFVAKSHS